MLRFKRFIVRYRYFFIFLLIFLFPRLVGLGIDSYEMDAGRWDVRSDKFIKDLLVGKFIGTYQTYHPGVTVMWLTGISKKILYVLFELKNGYSVTLNDGIVYSEWFFVTNFIIKFPLVLTISLTLAFMSYLLYKMRLDLKFVLLFSIFLSLEPFFLGISRFYHLTGLETAFGFAVIISLIYYYHSKNKLYFVLTSLFLALSMLTKLSGFVLFPFLGLLLFLMELKASEIVPKKFVNSFSNKSTWFKLLNIIYRSIAKYVLLLLIAFIFFIALWPAIWVRPLYVLENIYSSGVGDHAFGDKPAPSLTSNKYLYYYEMLFTRSLGLTFLAFFASIFFIFKEKSKNIKLIYYINFAFVIYFAYIMAIPNKQIDRYTANLYPFVIICSTYFIYYLSKNLPKIGNYILFSFLLLYYGFLLWAYYPNFSAYHTDLVGGPMGYSKLAAVRNRGEFYMDLIRFLNEKDGDDARKKNLVVPRGEKDRSTRGYLGSVFTHDGLVPEGRDAVDYYAPDYLDIEEEIPKNRECNFIKGFGTRWPIEFNYLYLYECE